MKVLDLRVDALKRHPKNTRSKSEYTKGELADLLASIEAHGLLVPLLVMPGPNLGAGGKTEHTVLAGHRRLAAAQLLKMEEVPCRVLTPTDDAEALSLLLTENEQHEQPSPMLEAAAIEALLAEVDDPQPHERVAAMLGKSLAWVKARLRLCGLSDLWRRALAGEKVKLTLNGREGAVAHTEDVGELPVGHLEDMCVLPPEAQDALFVDLFGNGWGLEEGIPVRSVWKGWIRDQTQLLAAATFPKDEPVKGVDAPACNACPHRSSQEGVLFAEQSKKGDQDRCLKPSCFAAKGQAAVIEVYEAAVEKYGDDLQLEASSSRQFVPEGAEAFMTFDLSDCTKAKGGKPTLNLTTGKVKYRKKGSASSTPKTSVQRPVDPETGKPKPKPLKERREAHEQRRLKYALNAAQAVIRGDVRAKVGEKSGGKGAHPLPVMLTVPSGKIPTLDYVVHSILAHGTGYTGRRSETSGADGFVDEKEDRGVVEPQVHAALWVRARGPQEDRFKVSGPESYAALTTKWKEASSVLKAMAVDADAIKAACDELLPEPAGWAKLKADGTPKATKAKTPRPVPKAKKPKAKKEAATP